MSMSILTCYGVRLFFIEPWPSFREEDAVVRERKSDIAVLAYCETQALVLSRLAGCEQCYIAIRSLVSQPRIAPYTDG